MQVGLTGDIMRGGRAIGLSAPMALAAISLQEAIEMNAGWYVFLLTVNPFEKDRAQTVVRQWISAVRPKGILVRIETNPSFAQGAWLLQPLDGEGERA